jgi:hypothetical protein
MNVSTFAYSSDFMFVKMVAQKMSATGTNFFILWLSSACARRCARGPRTGAGKRGAGRGAHVAVCDHAGHVRAFHGYKRAKELRPEDERRRLRRNVSPAREESRPSRRSLDTVSRTARAAAAAA